MGLIDGSQTILIGGEALIERLFGHAGMIRCQTGGEATGLERRRNEEEAVHSDNVAPDPATRADVACDGGVCGGNRAVGAELLAGGGGWGGGGWFLEGG